MHYFFAWIFFLYLVFFTPSKNSSMINSFRIIFIKITIIETDFTNICTKNTLSATKNLMLLASSLIKIILSSPNNALFLSSLLVANQLGTNFNPDRQPSTALSHMFWVLYLSRQNFSTESSSGATFITYLFSLLLIGKRLKYKKQVLRALSEVS